METAEQSPEATVADKNKFKDIPLGAPIVRGDTKIENLTLRKPGAGELRGLTLQDIYSLDVGTILTIVTRISNPPLTAEEANALDPSDLMEIGGAIKDFFLTTAERAAMDEILRTMTGASPSSP